MLACKSTGRAVSGRKEIKMAHSRLHIICGNCGERNNAKFRINPEGHDISDDELKFEPAVFIICNNCATLHDLSDFIKEEAALSAAERGLK